MRPRPRGVTYLALVFGLFGLLVFPAALLGALSFAAAGGAYNFGVALLALLFPQLLLAAAYGLWKLKPWGLLVAGIALIASATTALAAAAHFPPTREDAPQWFRFALSLVGLGYLMTPRVRAAFARRQDEP